MCSVCIVVRVELFHTPGSSAALHSPTVMVAVAWQNQLPKYCWLVVGSHSHWNCRWRCHSFLCTSSAFCCSAPLVFSLLFWLFSTIVIYRTSSCRSGKSNRNQRLVVSWFGWPERLLESYEDRQPQTSRWSHWQVQSVSAGPSVQCLSEEQRHGDLLHWC